MSSTHGGAGRLGNHIFRNLALSQIAEAHDLYVDYSYHTELTALGLSLFVGTKRHPSTITLEENMYFDILNRPALHCNLGTLNKYYQTKEISNFLYSRIRIQAYQQNIRQYNPFKIRYGANNDVVIHLRLGDIAEGGFNPSVDYYLKALSLISSYDSIYLSTDNANHPIVKQIFKQYPAAQILGYNEIQTIQFASTCKHVILSHGSFSAVIGYLAFDSDVYYPAYEWAKTMWFGDIFSIPGWNKVMLEQT
jgi:hypothetical protein